MQHQHHKRVSPRPDLIPGLACILLMSQAYFVAPLSPTLTKDLGSSLINMAVPIFALAFAIAAVAMVLIKPPVDLRKCFLISLASLSIGAYLLSITQTAASFLLVRAFTGFGTGIMLPSALLLALQPNKSKQSLSHMVLIIFSIATGMTFGPSLGGWLNGSIGWRCLYQLTSALAGLLFLLYYLKEVPYRDRAILPPRKKRSTSLISNWKNRYVDSFVYLTGVFHSGVFVWISHYFSVQYKLGEFHIATDLFIFGLPGFLLTIFMYYYQLDKKVLTILYASLGLTAAGLLTLMGDLPLWLAECLLGVLSIGFGCSQPLFIGILKLPPARISPVAPVAKGSGLLFAGYGSGPLMMIALLTVGLGVSMLFLLVLMLVLAYVSRQIWVVIEPNSNPVSKSIEANAKFSH